jgi:glyoxylase-like metal-dependent hydrolase (beta-lactamase superfamily II)
MKQPLNQSSHPSLSPSPVPTVQAFFDPATWTISYVVYEKDGGACAIIDSVLDYDPKSGRTGTGSADQLIAFIRAHDLRTTWILETHAHADHLSAAPYLRQQLGGQIAIGDKIKEVQATFHKVFNLGPACPSDGAQFDHLFHAGESFNIGNLNAQALAVPGHTPADMAYRIGDAVFIGDTLFMPDVGTARCDFPGGNAHVLYQSVRAILALPPETRLYMCHDYPPESRGPAWQCTVAQQRADNIHIHDGIDEAAFVAMRTRRDATLAMPTLILPAIQVNIHAGQLPAAEENGIRYLKIPIDAL